MSFNFIDNKNKKIYFIGIGGISMSGLAFILLKNGFDVAGSDAKASDITDRLENEGAKIFIGQKKENIHGADLVVYTAAISEDNPELMECRKLNIPVMDRAEFLGHVMKGHKYNIAVSGTHGKTTTTSMISHIALKAKLDPTILVGGNLDVINGNVRAAKSDYFITEACEYKASFLKFFPYIGIILNVDADHLDFYKDIDDIEKSFSKFASLIPKEGYLIANSEDERVMRIAEKVNCNVLTFGIHNGEVTAKNIIFTSKGCANYDLYFKEKYISNIELNVPGKHNILNSLAAAASSLALDVPADSIKGGLNEFAGTHRRFEIKGIRDNVTVIDDYAHHPTEIKATLNAAVNYPHKRIVAVFQPHTYSRTITLFDEFTNAFEGVDQLILADIYAAREKDTGIVSSDMLGDSIRKLGHNCVNIHSCDEIVKYLKKYLSPGDILLTIGAGDIYLVGEEYLK